MYQEQIAKLRSLGQVLRGGDFLVFSEIAQDAADALENQLREINALKQIIEKQSGLNQRLADMALELEKEAYRRKKQAEVLIDLRGQKYELLAKISELHTELDQAKAERDAAVKDIPHKCATCRLFEGGACPILAYKDYPDDCDHWEWRGPQKEE